MRPVNIKDANVEYAKPRDWDDAKFGPCGTLSVRRDVIGTGDSARLSMFSNWKPSANELRVLNAGGCVELECCGVQPAVSIGVVSCADESEVERLPFPLPDIRGAVARGWCADGNTAKEFDGVLAEAISLEVAKFFRAPM